MDLRKRREKEIIYAAMNIFSKNGFENSKMEDIASEAGIGKGTIYGYFTSKIDLFEEMICYNMSQYKEELSKIILEDSCFSQKLDRLFHYHASFIGENLDIFQLMDSGRILSESMKKKLIEEQNIFLDLIEKMIEIAITSGELKESIDKETAGLCILGAINYLTSKKIFMDKINPDEIDSSFLVDIFMEGLKI